MKHYYFSKYEHRVPYQTVKSNIYRTRLFQLSAILTLITGLIYFHWRWTSSLNFELPVFSITLAVAESLSFIGICLLIFDLWQVKDSEIESPPRLLSEIEPLEGRQDRPVKIDVFIATLNEDME